MSNLVEFIVKIRDMASSPMMKIANTGNSSFTKLEQVLNKVTGKMGNLKMSIKDIDKKLSDLSKSREISLDGRQIRRINREMGDLEKKRNRLTNGNGSAGGIGGLIKQGIAIAGIGSIAAMGMGLMKGGMEREMNTKSFEVLAGKKAGGQLAGNVTKFASDTIYGNEVFDNAKTMLGFGIDVKNIMPAMRMIGDVAMGSADKMKSLTLAFSQSSSTGRLMGQDLLQFVNAGFNPLFEISKMTGESMATLNDKMEKGQIPFSMVAKAFEHATGKGGKFHDMMNQLAQTPTGKWNAFTGNLSTMAATLGQSLLPVLGAFVDGMNWILERPAVFASFATGIGLLVVAWQGYSIYASLAALATSGISLGLIAIVALGAILFAALVGGIVYAWNHFEGFRKVVMGLWETFKQVFNNISNLFKVVFSPIGEAISAILNGDWKKAAVSLLKMNPVAIASRAIEFTAKGGLTEGLTTAYKKGTAMGAQSFKNYKEKKELTPLDAFKGSETSSSTKGSLHNSLSETNKGITSGGVKNLTINIGKMNENIVVKTTNLTEGIKDIEDKISEMFLRIVNSGAAVMD
jgi:tape measure domain-containing protein